MAKGTALRATLGVFAAWRRRTETAAARGEGGAQVVDWWSGWEPPSPPDDQPDAPSAGPPEPESPADDGGATAILALSALFAAALALLALGFVLDVAALRAVGVCGALLFGVGAAPMQLSTRIPLAARLGIAGVVALSVVTIVATVMALTPLWYPVPVALVLVLVAAGLHLRACRRVRPELDAVSVRRWAAAARPSGIDLSSACTGVGTALWLGAALARGHVVPGVGGFLPGQSPAWYAGLLLLIVGLVSARGRSEAHMLFAVASLVAALTVTPALLYGMPRSQSAAKHVDLVQQVLRHHYLNRKAGIYDAYSGFFAAIAWLCDLARIHDSIGIATWWPVIIAPVTTIELRALFGRVADTSFRICAAMTLAILANSIGADYFSPQSAGFTLSLGVFALFVGREWPGLRERTRILLLLLAGCSLAVTHELSPYIVGGVLVVLALTHTGRPRWAAVCMFVPAGLWALLNRSVLSGFVNFSHLGNLSNFAPPKTVATPGLSRLAIVGQSSDALLLALLLLIGLAAVGFLRHIRKASSWTFGISAGVGLAFVAVNPYGNEGIFRAALFGIPWLVTLATRAIGRRPSRFAPWAFGALAVALLGLFLVSSFGLDNADVIRPADLRAWRIYESRTAVNGYLLNLSYGDIPSTVAVAGTESRSVTFSTLVKRATFEPGRPNAADASSLARRFIRYAARNAGTPPSALYALWSPASVRYSVDYGLETVAHAKAWLRQIAASPAWRLVYAHDGTYLFRIAVRGAAAAPARA